MRPILFLTLALALCSRAETLMDAVARHEAAGVQSAPAIADALASPSVALVTNLVDKTAGEIQAEADTLAAVRAFTDAVGTNATDRAEGLRLVRKGRGGAFWAWANQRVMSQTTANQLANLRRYARIQDIVRESGHDLASGEFGAARRAVVVASPGPAWWQANGLPAAPTEAHVRAAMMERAAP